MQSWGTLRSGYRDLRGDIPGLVIRMCPLASVLAIGLSSAMTLGV